MISVFEKIGTVEILDWPLNEFLNQNQTRKLLNLLLLITNWSPKIPKQIKGYFYQQQLGPLRGNNNVEWEIRIHDIFPITNPEWFNWWSRRVFRKALVRAVDGNAIFRCISEFTKNELVKHYPQVEARSYVDFCQVKSMQAKICEKCLGCEVLKNSTPINYILAVGTIEPRKNYKQLIRLAYLLPNVQFIVVGKVGWKSKSIQKKLAAGIKNLDWISSCCDGALNIFYTNALLFISTSSSEGFNLPALEARELHGLPLILSDIPVHREIHEKFADFFTSDADAVKIIQFKVQ